MTSKLDSIPGLQAGEWLKQSLRLLGDRLPGPENSLSLQLLLAHALGKKRSWVLAHPETVLSSAQIALLEDYFQRLISGIPLPYLIGSWEFYGREFEVNPHVLIPRPETELLVDRALAWLESHPGQVAVDVGTGSGCIAVSLAGSSLIARCLAVDCSWNALQVARRNATRHAVQDRIFFLQSDLLSACAGPFDLVCANLPYIPAKIAAILPVGQFEPLIALAGGEDGLRFIRALLVDARRWLSPGGLMLLEMQFDQGKAISNLVNTYLPGAKVEILPDLTGLPRLVEIQN